MLTTVRNEIHLRLLIERFNHPLYLCRMAIGALVQIKFDLLKDQRSFGLVKSTKKLINCVCRAAIGRDVVEHKVKDQ
jgi:hypothetical protein